MAKKASSGQNQSFGTEGVRSGVDVNPKAHLVLPDKPKKVVIPDPGLRKGGVGKNPPPILKLPVKESKNKSK